MPVNVAIRAAAPVRGVVSKVSSAGRVVGERSGPSSDAEAIAVGGAGRSVFCRLAGRLPNLILAAWVATQLTACQVAQPKGPPQIASDQPAAAAPAGRTTSGAVGDTAARSPKALLTGVPFIGFAEAARMRLPHEVLMFANPAHVACLAMMVENWGASRILLEQSGPTDLDRWQDSSGQAQSFEEIKALVSKGLPVMVIVALTPYGERFPDTAPNQEMAQKLGMAEGPRSGVLGRIVRFDDVPKIEREWGFDPLQEGMQLALFASSRLVIGYDDQRGVVVLHDPTFGPAFEMRYEDFLLTWEPLGRRYDTVYPPDYAQRLAKKRLGTPYRQASPRERAALHYVYGYALNASGRAAEGAAEFRKGLAVQKIGRGYEHLLWLESGFALGALGDLVHAKEAAEQATASVPGDPVAWRLMAELYALSPGSDAAAKSQQAQDKADKLTADEGTRVGLSRVLPRDFWVMTLGHWAGR
jgi:hypothetical protein